MPQQISNTHRFRFELELVQMGITLIAGVDEAGRVIFPTEDVSKFSL
jgi:hypothetical protein